ncbi:small, acid-soluble spore protein, alpha/beta type [Effusibacillus dendaii]|nr:small, acid-soluble spore protein, alpha/beta type [Effusibacillus dendaii]
MEKGWENMTTGQVGKIGGNMVRRMIRLAEDEMAKRSK